MGNAQQETIRKKSDLRRGDTAGNRIGIGEWKGGEIPIAIPDILLALLSSSLDEGVLSARDSESSSLELGHLSRCLPPPGSHTDQLTGLCGI